MVEFSSVEYMTDTNSSRLTWIPRLATLVAEMDTVENVQSLTAMLR